MPARRRPTPGARAARAPVRERIAALPWDSIRASLAERGYAVTPRLLGVAECRELIGLYADASRFRSRVAMGPRRFGEGEYQYFANPLPPLVRELRQHLYPPLARIANDWHAQLGSRERYPRTLGGFLRTCRAAGQTRPTPLLLRYTSGGYNCLHRDRYGAVAFPLQVAFALSNRETDYRGGEFLLVEQRPRAQSRGVAISLERGEAIVFPNGARPVRGARGFHRVHTRHGVSTLHAGERYALGIIFHEAA
ncbi:MAG: 2OG-Fe(II) oxygenase [Deltaproteobacteria bacterium]|nr:MAG: 2OG-Fe(II) oxygenase [Deltaproteobacteria bacterium]